MTATSFPSSSTNDIDDAQDLDALIARLLQDSDRESVGSEIEVLKSIYGDDAIRIWKPAAGDELRHLNDDKIRYEVEMGFPDPYEEVKIKVLVSLTPSYPSNSPPQLQLLSRYIGAFGVDSNLFGSILRTFISSNGVDWTPDVVCVFDGLQNMLDRCVAWYKERLSADESGELLREDMASHNHQNRASSPDLASKQTTRSEVEAVSVALPDGIEIFEASPIVDRKSSFVGRACTITDPSQVGPLVSLITITVAILLQVPLILAHLSSDRRIARAAHPIINAWRCQVGNVLHQDNDDDGETAAGGRLAHLLQILEINNVLVIVTRYFGGIHLGPDRFKHINQAARNALDVGGFLDSEESKMKGNVKGRKR
ncbi:hypothetical protein E1B28_004766 [Marasmius oreades]|uniref:RWD domain-containing protein n=1 Tax=Marasmius oreades TaxID=181124 RepID=A0A9P7UZA2_9AGAR|nr:uncharacterized protein E1B28_004766 [Marasmius oreades]KAG7097419.1 hypothetical protein E1B28_004766 [Marasmius oreades]